MLHFSRKIFEDRPRIFFACISLRKTTVVCPLLLCKLTVAVWGEDAETGLCVGESGGAVFWVEYVGGEYGGEQDARAVAYCLWESAKAANALERRLKYGQIFKIQFASYFALAATSLQNPLRTNPGTIANYFSWLRQRFTIASTSRSTGPSLHFA